LTYEVVERDCENTQRGTGRDKVSYNSENQLGMGVSQRMSDAARKELEGANSSATKTSPGHVAFGARNFEPVTALGKRLGCKDRTPLSVADPSALPGKPINEADGQASCAGAGKFRRRVKGRRATGGREKREGKAYRSNSG